LRGADLLGIDVDEADFLSLSDACAQPKSSG
jgi:hypothetical protein